MNEFWPGPLAGSCVPDTHSPIRAGAHDPFTVTAELGRGYLARMRKLQFALSGPGVPKNHAAVAGRGEDVPPIWTEHRYVQIAVTPMGEQWHLGDCYRNIPELGQTIFGHGYDL